MLSNFSPNPWWWSRTRRQDSAGHTCILTGVVGLELFWWAVQLLVVVRLHWTQMLVDLLFVNIVPEADNNLMMLLADGRWRRRRRRKRWRRR